MNIAMKPRAPVNKHPGAKTEPPAAPRLSPFGRLFRFFATWFGLTGLYTAFAVCPFCGQPGCPVGLASAGTVGAFLTLCVQDWKRFFSYLRRRCGRTRNNDRQQCATNQDTTRSDQCR
jgi:hypothetical protein